MFSDWIIVCEYFHILTASVVWWSEFLATQRIQRSGFDSQRYQIFWEVVSLERGPLSLVSTTEELLERNSSGSGLEIREYGRRVPSRWPHGTLYPQMLALTSLTGGGRSVGIVRSRTEITEFSFFLILLYPPLKFLIFFFLKDPIYLQSVIIHSANGGKGEGWHVEEYSVNSSYDRACGEEEDMLFLVMLQYTQTQEADACYNLRCLDVLTAYFIRPSTQYSVSGCNACWIMIAYKLVSLILK
jgi:hypothetical protein